MKKYIMVTITLLALSSCTESKNKEIETHSSNRIIEKEYSIIPGVRVQIIEIDNGVFSFRKQMKEVREFLKNKKD